MFSAGTFKRIKPEGTVFMEETILKNVILCHVEVSYITFISFIIAFK